MTDKHTLALQRWGNEISRAITRISGGGSEMTLRIGEDFYADPVATCARIEEKLEGHRRRYSEAATRITALEAREAELVERLGWYANTFCEQGPYSEVCGRLSPDECAGCLARATLAKARQSGEGE